MHFENQTFYVEKLQSSIEDEFKIVKGDLTVQEKNVIINFINDLESIRFMYDEEKIYNLTKIEIEKILKFLNQYIFSNDLIKNEIIEKTLKILVDKNERIEVSKWAENLLNDKEYNRYKDILLNLVLVNVKNKEQKFIYSNEEIINWLVELK